MDKRFKSNPKRSLLLQVSRRLVSEVQTKVLIHGVDVRLKEILLEVATEFQVEIIEMEVMDDHVHILMDIDPQFGVAKVVRYMKGRSSRLLRQEFAWLKSRLPTLWTNSYFVSTVGGAPLSAIKQYIENQKNV